MRVCKPYARSRVHVEKESGHSGDRNLDLSQRARPNGRNAKRTRYHCAKRPCLSFSSRRAITPLTTQLLRPTPQNSLTRRLEKENGALLYSEVRVFACVFRQLHFFVFSFAYTPLLEIFLQDIETQTFYARRTHASRTKTNLTFPEVRHDIFFALGLFGGTDLFTFPQLSSERCCYFSRSTPATRQEG